MVSKICEKKKKESIKRRASYAEKAAKYVTPMSALMTEDSRVAGVDAAFSYIGEKYDNPPAKVYILAAICFVIGLLVGGFAVTI